MQYLSLVYSVQLQLLVMNNVLFSVQCIMRSVKCTVLSRQWKMFSGQCVVCVIRSELVISHCRPSKTMHTILYVQCAFCSLQYVVGITPLLCAVCSEQCAVYSEQIKVCSVRVRKVCITCPVCV